MGGEQDHCHEGMPARSTVEALARFDERLKTAEGNVKVLHGRIDKLGGEIKADLVAIRDSVQPIRDSVNRGKGTLAGLLMAASIVGGIVTAVVSAAFGK